MSLYSTYHQQSVALSLLLIIYYVQSCIQARKKRLPMLIICCFLFILGNIFFIVKFTLNKNEDQQQWISDNVKWYSITSQVLRQDNCLQLKFQMKPDVSMDKPT